MHTTKLDQWRHGHNFFVHREENEKNTQRVMGLTAVTMVVEIAAGLAFGSMALLADGWHMGTHVAAFLITLFAYRYARKHADNPNFTFSPGKITVLGGFASAVALAVVALVTHCPRPANDYRELLPGFEQLSHITIEVIRCDDEPCIALEQAV